MAGRVSGFQAWAFERGGGSFQGLKVVSCDILITSVVPVFNPQIHYEEKQLPGVEEKDGKSLKKREVVSSILSSNTR